MISTAILQDHLGVTGSETALERLEKGVVTFLQSWIPRYLGPPLERPVVLGGGSYQDGGLIFHGNRDQEQLLLPTEIAFEDLVSVQHRDHPSLPWEDLDTGLDAYEVEGRSLYRLAGPWPAGQRNVRVVYMEGFEEDQGPADVVLVALELIKAKWDQRQAEGVKTDKAGELTITYADTAKVPGLSEALNQLKRSRNF